MPRAEPQTRRTSTLSREEILAAAVTAFSQKGYRGTNLQDVAAVLGVTRQAIYYHYRNKHALLHEMFERFFDDLDEAVEAAATAEADPAKRFEQMLRAHVIIVARTPATSSIFTREFEALQPEAQSAVRQRRRGYQARFVEAYTALEEAGEARALPTGETISLMFGAVNWTFRWYDPTRSKISPEALADLVLDLFRSGYAVPAKPKRKR
jgi:AcrR family transcriptional regulator